MQQTFYRFIAVLLLVIPGFLATYGFLLMKDAWFAQFGPEGSASGIVWGQLLIGAVLFAAGVSFIGGWIFFRDRKRNYVAPRFKKKRSKDELEKLKKMRKKMNNPQ